jgi:hypothetical protein
MTRATSGHAGSSQTSLVNAGPWLDHNALAPNNSPMSSALSSEADLSESIVEFLTDSAATTLPSNVSTASFTLEDGTNTSETHCDAEELKEEDYSATYTIIRPMARPSFRDFFSHPSSPNVSRPSSPIVFSTLNCFGSTDAFEDEVDQLQVQRVKELVGQAGVRVFITQKREVHTEELWRDAIQEVLYGNRLAAGTQGLAGPD